MDDADLLAIVWSETSGLNSKPVNPATLERLQVVVFKLAGEAKRRGLQNKMKSGRVPDGVDDNLPAFQAMQKTIEDYKAGRWTTPVELPARAVLWEIDGNGSPPRDRPVPQTAAWILTSEATHSGDFTTSDGTTYRLFESPKVPADSELPYISARTGTGVPAPAAPPQPWYKSSAWRIGLSGGALFFLAAFSLQWTASSFSHAYDLLSSRQVGLFDNFVAETCKHDPKSQTCVDEQKTPGTFVDQASKCASYLTDWAVIDHNTREQMKKPPPAAEPWAVPTNPKAGQDRAENLKCLRLLGHAVTYSARNLVITADWKDGTLPQYIAVAVQAAGNWIFGWHVPSDGTQAVSMVLPTAFMMLGVILVLVGLGKGVEGTPLGALIDPNHRYSLALAQVTFWTVLVLTGAMAIAIFNGGLVSDFVRYFPKAVAGWPNAAVEGFFPYIPNALWGVLGISFGSTIVSKLFNSLKGSSTKEAAQFNLATSREKNGISFFQSPIINDPGHRGSIADWFLGEEAGNLDRIDISRVQMVLITAGLLVTYGNALFASVRGLSPQEIFLAIKNVDVLIATLPPVGTSMAAMLAISHATYLVAKAADAPGAPAKEGEKPPS